jgi:hypothetical protein
MWLVENFESEFWLLNPFGGVDPKFRFRCRAAVLWKGFTRAVGTSGCVEAKFRFVFPVDVLSCF